MRTAIAAALLLAACSDTPPDPAWITAGSAGPCTDAALPDPVGTYAARWACMGSGVNGDQPCDPDINPALGDESIVVRAAGAGFTVAVGGVDVALERVTPEALSSGYVAAGSLSRRISILGCSEAEATTILYDHWRPVSDADLHLSNAWVAVLTRQ